MRADAVAASGLESDTSKTRTCEAKKDLERGTNSTESNLVAKGFRDSLILEFVLEFWLLDGSSFGLSQCLEFCKLSLVSNLEY